MTFTNALNSAGYVHFQVAPILKRLAGATHLDNLRLFLRTARDNLHTGCTHFERNGGAEEFEDLYIPIFDALSHLNYALGQKHVHAESVRAAHACMVDLGERLAAVPA